MFKLLDIKILLPLLLASFITACTPTEAAVEQNASAVAAASVPPAKTVSQPQRNVLLDEAWLHQAQIALTQRPEFSGSKIQVFEKINFFDGVRPRIELAAQNPALPTTLTFYTFENGVWTPSEAEDISHVKQLHKHLFALDSVDFRQASRFARAWQEKAKNVQAAIDEPYYVALIWLPKTKKRFWHTATLEAVGKQFYLSFHDDGQVWEFKNLATGNSLEEQ